MLNDKNAEKRKFPKYLTIFLLFFVLLLSLPIFLIMGIKKNQNEKKEISPELFPVTVDPVRKIITENTEVNLYLNGNGTSSPLEANISNAFNSVWDGLKLTLISIAETPWYQNIASVAGIDGHIVKITPGMRKEQVVNAFANALDWDKSEKQEFLIAEEDENLPFSEGTFFPDVYFVDDQMSPKDVQDLVNKNFTENVLVRYGTSTERILPIEQALNIASIIQRETIGNKDVRLISGILWNRLFIGMKLQVDATLQYAKANKTQNSEWWPNVRPADKYINSPYNTYKHNGLPPTPIANPSVGAILAALNPIKTDCLYYFNDKSGEFHCSTNYKDHVKLIKKYY